MRPALWTIACFVPAALLMVGCRGAALAPEPADLLTAHLEDARAVQAGAGEAGLELEALDAKVLELRAAWEKKLENPERLQEILDFDAPGMHELRERARAPDFEASLAQAFPRDLVLAAVFERNPGIKAARLKLRGTVEQFAQVTQLDTILRQYASFQRSSHTKVGMPLPGDTLDKQFPFPGSLELKAALVRHGVEEAQARFSGTVRDLVVRANTAYAGYIFLGEAIELSRAMLQYLKQLEEAARSKLSSGSGPKGAVLQTQVEISNLENDIVTLRRKREIVQARLATLIDVPLSTKLAGPSPSALPAFPADEAALTESALKSQPDLLAVRARERRMATMVELAEQMAYPALSSGLSEMAGLSHATGGSDKQREPFTTRPKGRPAPFFGTADAYLREARESVRAAAARVRAVENLTRLAVKDAHVELETAKRLLELYRDVQLAQAEQAYRDAASGYAADRVEFLNVVDTLRRWLRFQLEAERAARDYQQAHASLEGAVGHRIPDGK